MNLHDFKIENKETKRGNNNKSSLKKLHYASVTSKTKKMYTDKVFDVMGTNYTENKSSEIIFFFNLGKIDKMKNNLDQCAD